MAVGYRTVLTVAPGDDARKIARKTVGDWLHGKVKDSQDNAAIVAASRLSFDRSFQARLGSSLAVTNTLVDDGHGQSQQAVRLDETHPTGDTWRVNVLATRVESPGRREQTITVELDPLHLKHDDAVLRGAPPRFVRTLLDEHVLRSGQTRVTGSPLIVTGDNGARDARRAILDQSRQVSVVVASPVPGAPLTAWAKAIEALTKDAVGVSTAFVLDEPALNRLNNLLPEWLQLDPGEVRTFAPRVDLDDETDGIRHRRLSPGTFQRHLHTHRRSGDLRVDPTFTRVHAQRARVQFLDQSLTDSTRTLAQLTRSEELRVARRTLPSRPQGPVQLLTRPGQALPSQQSASRTSQPHRPDVDTAVPRSERTSPETSRSEQGTRAPSSPVGGADTTTHTASAPMWAGRLQTLLGELLGDAELTETSDDLLIEHVRLSADELTRTKEQLATAESQLDEAIQMAADAEYERDFAQVERDEIGEALRDSETELMRTTHVATVLQNRASKKQDWAALDEAHAESPWDEVPETVLELTDRLAQTEPITPHVVFTGDRSLVEEVTLRDRSGHVAATFWNHVRALDDFARARRDGFAGGVHMYLKSDTPGHKCTPTQHAAGESDSVRGRRAWADERLLPVPREVDPSGFVHMFAHFKTAGGGSFAPRMHYFDDTANTGKLYIGYIGRHLTTTRTASV